MIDPNKLQYFTMAAWLRGFAEGIDNGTTVSTANVNKLKKAADMLDFVFSDYIDQGDRDERV